MKRIVSIVTLWVLLILVAGCSTKKNTLVTRSYHNLTSKYNIYFNASESFNQGLSKAENSYRDDFNKPIPIYIYSTKEATRSMLPDMDKTIKKCSKVITMHSLKAKPKMKKRGLVSEREKAFYKKNEYVKWIDDAFLMMGKANFLKQDFIPAIENFEFVVREYPDDGLKPEANLWLAKSYIGMKKYTDAQEILNRMQANPEFPKELKPELLTTWADLYMRQEDWSSATQYLAQTINDYPDKKQRTRNQYVMAQLYERLDEKVLASQAYASVIELNPPYEMLFNARINRARLYEGDPASGEEIRKELLKMLKDDKNLEYLDQVYYALAELDSKEGNMEEAIKNYKLSIWNSLQNNTQKALSYLALGKYYFSQPDWLPAAAYYDSCMQFLPEDFPGNKEIVDLALTLKTLSDNLTIVIREDSLQQVAAMPIAERDKLIEKKIAEAIKAEEERKAREQEERMNMNNSRQGNRNASMMQGNRSSMRGGASQGRSMTGGNPLLDAGGGGDAGGLGGAGGTGMDGASGFYFYNPSLLAFGNSEFMKIWGRRKLEDNWRRSNKRISSMTGDMATEGEEGEIATPVTTSKASQFQPTEKDYYLADLPTNDTLLQESHSRIASALFNLGKVFKDQLKMPMEAIPNFERLNNRYPENERILPSYYNLYQIYTEMNATEPALTYKNLILEKFPDSRSAKIISNPNYFQEVEEARQKTLSFYTRTYQAYQAQFYETTLINCAEADTAFSYNPIRDKFEFLGTVAYTRLNPTDTLGIKERLNQIIFKFPESDVAKPAKNMLSYIEKGPESKGIKRTGSGLQIGRGNVKATETEPAEYQFDSNSTHYYVIVISVKSLDVNRLKFRLADFNVERFSEGFLEVNAIMLDQQADLQIIVVKNFPDMKSGMDYYHAVIADPKIFSDMVPTDYRHFIISKDNYTKFFQDKNVFQYIQFFRDKYLGE